MKNQPAFWEENMTFDFFHMKNISRFQEFQTKVCDQSGVFTKTG